MESRHPTVETHEAFNVFLPKVEAFAKKPIEEVTSEELNSLIDESSKIEGVARNQQISRTLFDLNRALFQKTGVEPRRPAESVFEELKEIV